MKILLAVDGSECSNAAVASVAARPWPAGTEIRVLSALELPFVPTPETWALPDSYYVQLEEAAKEAAEKAVGDATTQLEASGLQTTTSVKTGQAKSVIVDEAESWGADLIVLGSHGYSGWQRFWLGSVSNAVASQAHCSVEIVRQRKEH
ncbi:MAG: universal stress protein [Acidobacteria bacterium]|nr:universal stress protein [Acidobacteriota bacterium]MBI3425622.1 universal stress protein [Acidobacteriota bacterium]